MNGAASAKCAMPLRLELVGKRDSCPGPSSPSQLAFLSFTHGLSLTHTHDLSLTWPPDELSSHFISAIRAPTAVKPGVMRVTAYSDELRYIVASALPSGEWESLRWREKLSDQIHSESKIIPTGCHESVLQGSDRSLGVQFRS